MHGDRTRYSRWDGTQLVHEITPEEILRALSDDLLNEGDLDLALQRLFRFGFQSESGERFPGLREMLERLRQKRQQQLQRYDMDSVLRDIEKRLGQIVQRERDAIEQRVAAGRDRSQESSGESDSADDETTAPPSSSNQELQKMLEQIAERKSAQLDALPPDAAGQIRGLQEYEFLSQQAAADFQALLDELQQQVIQKTFQGMQQSLSQMTSADIAGMQQMMRELNEMLERRQRGEDPNFNEFMHRWGHYFGRDVHNLDELIDQMRKQMTAMQRMLESMTPDQRAALQQAMQAALQDPGLQEQMQRLSRNLGLTGGETPRQHYRFRGDESLGLAEAMSVMDRLQELDQLEQELRDVRDWKDLARIDDDRFRSVLGEEEAEQLAQLSRIAQTLEDAGLIRKNRRGYELTPQGVRRIGEKALEDIFLHLQRDRTGQHDSRHQGTAGERLNVTKRYEFGDPFLLDLPKTVMNAVQRQGAGAPIRLSPDDFEVYRTEQMTRTSTVLMVDLSRSMFYNGCFAAARKVALALDSLIRSKYPRDDLAILGFSSMAHPLKPTDLATLEWNEYQFGTNMQHGFQLARQILARQKGSNKQIIMITDGEPTVHLEHGRPQFQYPPTPRTFQETLREVLRCTREGITINTFMLEQSPYMLAFVNDLMRINGGRVFVATPEHLGEYLLVDYVAHKQKKIG